MAFISEVSVLLPTFLVINFHSRFILVKFLDNEMLRLQPKNIGRDTPVEYTM